MRRIAVLLLGLAGSLLACETTEPTVFFDIDPSDINSDAAIDTGGDAGPDATGAIDAADTAVEPDMAQGPQPPAPPAYAGGTCPGLIKGKNAILVGTKYRQLTLYMPDNPVGAGVAFAWHGFGDSTANFGAVLNSATAAQSENTIVILPEPDYELVGFGIKTWGFLGAPEDDLALFDAVLSCLDSQYSIDRKRVATIGFSAGALWSSLLLTQRGPYLSSAVLWSGGTDAGGLVVIPYETPGSTTAIMSAWGGDADIWGSPPLGVDFKVAGIDLADKLQADDHMVVRCDHGLGHTIPNDGLAFTWGFIAAHQWGAESPYPNGAVGQILPSYCVAPTE